MGAFFLSFFILSELSSSGLRLSALALIFLGEGGVLRWRHVPAKVRCLGNEKSLVCHLCSERLSCVRLGAQIEIRMVRRALRLVKSLMRLSDILVNAGKMSRLMKIESAMTAVCSARGEF